jgi:hypothetical protein
MLANFYSSIMICQLSNQKSSKIYFSMIELETTVYYIITIHLAHYNNCSILLFVSVPN